MIKPLLGIALKELPPTILPLTVSVPAMLAFPPTVMLLVGDKLEAVKAPVQARLPTVRAPDTPPLPIILIPLLFRLEV